MFTTHLALPPADPDRAFVRDALDKLAQEAARLADIHLLQLDLPAWLTANGIAPAPGRPALRRVLASGESHLARVT